MFRTCTSIWDLIPWTVYFVSPQDHGICLFSLCTFSFCFHFIFVVSCKEARHIFHFHERTQNRSKYSINFQAEYEVIHCLWFWVSTSSCTHSKFDNTMVYLSHSFLSLAMVTFSYKIKPMINNMLSKILQISH